MDFLSRGRWQSEARQTLAEPERRALAFLSREVPRWPAEHHCFSCHNNGDAARALYVAHRLTGEVPPAALEETTRWLGRPQGWEHNGGEGEFNDPVLARAQFSAALVEAMDAGLWNDPESLREAAALLVEHQRPDGTWPVDTSGNLGSPATHGAALATALARRTLLRADPNRYREEVAKIDAWLRNKDVRNVLNAAAVLIGLGEARDAAAVKQRKRCLDLIREGEAPGGGWGPYVNARPEAFDTAVVLLALAGVKGGPDITAMRQRGREYLVSIQLPSGSWRETTRPPGAESYAQRLSTTGWATLALLATPPRGTAKPRAAQ